MFDFIFSTIPINYVKEALNNEKQFILRRYFLSTDVEIKIGTYTPELKQSRIDIWLTLLKIYPEGLDSFMDKQLDITEESLIEYRRALKLIPEEGISNNL